MIRHKFWLIDSRMVWAAGEINPPVYIYVCAYVKIFVCVWKHILMCVCVGGLKLMFIIALQCIDLDRIVMLKLSLPVPDSGDLVSAS